MIQIKPIFWIIFLLSIALNIYFIAYRNTETIKVPAIVGSIKQAPVIHLEPKGEPLTVRWVNTPIKSKYPVNDSLISHYRDSLGLIQNELKRERERFKLYVDAVSIRPFESEFEDPFLKLKVKGNVQGYLRNIEISHYEIKEREISVPKNLFSVGPYIGIDFRGKVSGGVSIQYSIWEF